MIEPMNVAMALFDFVPVALFVIASLLLQRDLYPEMGKGPFAVFAAGTFTVGVAGIFKATWKLLYALWICDFVALNNCFFPMQTVGFLLAAGGILSHVSGKKPRNAVYSVAAAPVAYTSSMPFVILMVFGVLGLDGGLIVLAKRRGKTIGIVLYAVSFVFIMMMGYLSSRDFSEPLMNWIAEFVNTIGQGTFLAGTLVIRKAVAPVRNQ